MTPPQLYPLKANDTAEIPHSNYGRQELYNHGPDTVHYHLGAERKDGALKPGNSLEFASAATLHTEDEGANVTIDLARPIVQGSTQSEVLQSLIDVLGAKGIIDDRTELGKKK